MLIAYFSPEHDSLRFYNIDPLLAVIIGNGRASEIFGMSDQKFMQILLWTTMLS